MYTSILRIAVLVLLIGFSVRAYAAAPTAITSAADRATGTAAELNGVGNPKGEAAVGWFRYSTTNPGSCSDTFGTRVPGSGGTELGDEDISVPYSITTGSLSPGTTYYYCAIVSNSSGTAFGAIVPFTTPGPPWVQTVGVRHHPTLDRYMYLQGSANPNTLLTKGWFRFDTTNPGTCNDTFGAYLSYTYIGDGTSSIPYEIETYGGGVPFLAYGQTYYYCAIASNAAGTSFGEVKTFTLPAVVPSAYTSDATDVTGTTATLNGMGVPNGAAATGWFRISTAKPAGCNDTFGTRLPATGGTALGSDGSLVKYMLPAMGLALGTTYYYCAIVANSVGTGFGQIATFMTLALPKVSTLAATPVTATTAQLNGAINPNGSETTGWFRYSTIRPASCDDSFGTRAPVAGGTHLGSGSSVARFSVPLTGLTPAVTYYFCTIAWSPAGPSSGSVLSFTTPLTSLVSTDGTIGDVESAGLTTRSAQDVAAEPVVLSGPADQDAAQLGSDPANPGVAERSGEADIQSAVGCIYAAGSGGSRSIFSLAALLSLACALLLRSRRKRA